MLTIFFYISAEGFPHDITIFFYFRVPLKFKTCPNSRLDHSLYIDFVLTYISLEWMHCISTNCIYSSMLSLKSSMLKIAPVWDGFCLEIREIQGLKNLETTLYVQALLYILLHFWCTGLIGRKYLKTSSTYCIIKIN